ncbi:MAG: amino acid ABC transporter permease [Aerococcaceae bacterium]|nr:amino acid ABC transporter permease [Aerococcaceae bacterium]
MGNQTFLQEMWQIFVDNQQNYLDGTLNTLMVSLIGTVVGLLIGILVGIVRTIPKSKSPVKQFCLKVSHAILNAYVAIFRGTPMIVQATVVYYGTSIIWEGFNMTPMQAALLVVSINTGAYMSEVVRGGIVSIDKGQFEAARAIGMTHWQTMKEVVLPQALRNVLPSVGNEFVINIKDTSVLSVISMNELYFTTSSIAGSNFMFFQTFFVTAIIYFLLTYTVTFILRLVERKIDGNVTYELAGANQQQVAIIKDEVSV